MEKKEYLIGDVAEMMGVSRDTLRFYERRGIISVKKRENGYRYFSEEDIVKLCNVMYRRKMEIGLEDIEQFWKQDSSYRTIDQMADKKIAEEEAEIRKHMQILARLRLTKADCRKIEENLNRISIRSFPRAYVIERCKTQQESVREWFRLSQEHPGMDMIYTFDVFHCKAAKRGKEEGPVSGEEMVLTQKGTYLLLYQGLEKELDLDLNFADYPCTKQAKCVYTVLETPQNNPLEADVKRMISWAQEQGYQTGQRIYSVRLTQGSQGGKGVYYLELYMPLR